jgi:puromycin-sensitive aminopeptidase
MGKNVTKLLQSFKPEKYELHISLSEDKKTFNGTIAIKGYKTGRPSKRLTLHQKDLKISNARVTFTDKKGAASPVEVARTVLHKSYDEVRLHSTETLFPGNYEITLDFSGKITRNMDGIYPSDFELEGEKQQLIATQFESHSAREAFPCIDEPAAKATFQLTLVHDAQEVALSNTPVSNEKKDGTRTTTAFEPTPVMSTYLLAFVVGNLSYKEATTTSGVKIRTYTTPAHIHDTAFALDVAVKAMEFYEEYYDIPFPLEKCDFVALPDFASGAMENWGLITFREQLLLCNEHTSLSTKQYVAIVVAHELTHQWFGNLVTMEWWTDLWLNEGFASWMEYLAIDTFFPEWNLWTQFTVDEQQSALRADGLEHTHPIEVPVHHPDEIRTIFDIISYQKGASVIHMLHDYLGPEGFRDGLRHYLKKFAYKNTITKDLWQSLESVTGKPVTEFMASWTEQAGFPIIKVTEKTDQWHLQQSRFVTNPNSDARSDASLWPIPLFCSELDDQLLGKKQRSFSFQKNNQPLLLNKSQVGFYRVDYSNDIQKRQIQAIDAGKISDIDRMGLLSDSFEATRAGYQPVSDYLDLLQHYSKEHSMAVWEIIAASLGSIRVFLSLSDNDESLREAAKPFIRTLVAPQLQRLGWETTADEPHLDTLLRPTILALAAGADDEKTVQHALELYKAKIQDNQHLDPDLRGIVYATAARKGNEQTYNELLGLYTKSNSADEKLSLTSALTSFKQPEIHAKVLELIKTDTVRFQDTGYWIAYSFMNKHSKQATWNWLKENWQWLKQNVGTDLSFYRMPVYAARMFCTEEQKTEYINFFKPLLEPQLQRSYDQGLEMIETHTAWHNRDHQTALEWFKSQQS